MPIVFEAAMLLPSLIAVQVAKVTTMGVISHSSVCVCLVLILLGVHLLVKLADSASEEVEERDRRTREF